MILNQFKKALINPGGSWSFKYYDGTSASGLNCSSILNAPNNYQIILGGGGGSIEPTADDYKLENMITSLTAVSMSAVVGGEQHANKYTRFLTVTTTYSNDTSEAITITERGIVFCKKILATREILEEPVTIAPGESYAFTGVIDIT